MTPFEAYMSFFEVGYGTKDRFRILARIFQSSEFQEAWQIAKIRMSVRWIKIMERRYSDIPGKLVSLRTMGHEQNVSPARIRQLEHMAIRRMKHPGTTSLISGHFYEVALANLDVPLTANEIDYLTTMEEIYGTR